MPFMPFQVLGIWLRGLLALALLAASAALLSAWYTHRQVYVTELRPAPAEPRPGQADRIDRGPEREPPDTPVPGVQVRRIDWQFGFNGELAPVVWLMNWLSYLNGSAHRSTERSSFSGRESRG